VAPVDGDRGVTAVDLAGVVEDLDEETYHAHPALSASGAKRLLQAPALFAYERQHGRPPKAAFDTGHATHAQLLGVGGELVVVDADNWLTKAAKAQRDEARAEGKVPLLAADKVAVDRMVTAVRSHPIAGPLFVEGRPELSLFWEDWAHGVQRRARPDWIAADGTVVDLKTCVSAEPQQLRKTVATYGYHQQQAWYEDGIAELLGGPPARFLFVFVETSPPHLVTVVELDAEAVRVGRARNDEALRVFADCTRTGTWPGYCDDVQVLSLPPWAAPREDWD
jgi:hypothetical protein